MPESNGLEEWHSGIRKHSGENEVLCLVKDERALNQFCSNSRQLILLTVLLARKKGL
jgi:hypothetical protein